jgi:hypothetical protein
MYDGVDVRASLLWNNRNDLDLHVMTPGGSHIYYGAKRAPCGGWLDVDMNISGDTTKPVENVRWAKGTAPAGRYKVSVVNFRFHEPDQAPTPFKVELEVNGEVLHYEGVIAPNRETGTASEIIAFDFDFVPGAKKEEKSVDVYAQYSDDVVLGQWGTVIPSEHILKVGDPKSIIDVLMGALAIADGAADLREFIADLRERGQSEERIADVESALMGLGKVREVAQATVAGEVPSAPEDAPKRSKRL